MRRKTFNYGAGDFQLWGRRPPIMGRETSNYGAQDLQLLFLSFA